MEFRRVLFRSKLGACLSAGFVGSGGTGEATRVVQPPDLKPFENDPYSMIRSVGWSSMPTRGETLLNESFCRSEEHTSELQSLMRISYAVFCLNKYNQLHNTSSKPSYTRT